MSHRIAASAASLLLLAGISSAVYGSTLHTEHTDCLVMDKLRYTHRDHTYMRLYTTCGAFETPDDELYTQIIPDSIYNLTVTGYRIPLLSAYPLVVDTRPSNAVQ